MVFSLRYMMINAYTYDKREDCVMMDPTAGCTKFLFVNFAVRNVRNLSAFVKKKGSIYWNIFNMDRFYIS